ncbi:MAG: carbohydrate kinase [Tannerellaceae bacterium]|jgi:fructokinase|nr:carbohydrate kinase [Tannerellaceae bacterium]
MRKVIGIGETILDIIFENNRPTSALPGGSVFNGFITLARLDVPVVFISKLGNDRVGGIIREFMEENHIPTKYVDSFPDGKSPVSLAFLDNEHNADYLFYKDYPNQKLEVSFPKIEEDDILIFGSYYALNPVLRERTVELLEYAKERKAIIYYDLNFRNAHAYEAIRLRPTILENFEYADIIKASTEDIYNIFAKNDTKNVYHEHIRFYCKNHITTHGGDGVDLFTNTLSEHFNTPVISPLSTIGAGDSFNAGIIWGLLKYGIKRKDLDALDKEKWEKIIHHGIDLATEVCLTYDNYISPSFAKSYAIQS